MTDGVPVGSSGSSTTNRAPWPGWLSRWIEPPWPATISRTMNRPSPRPPIRAGGVAAREALEQRRLLVGGDAGAFVLHHQRRDAPVAGQRQLHRFPRGVLDGVDQQVVDDLLDPDLIERAHHAGHDGQRQRAAHTGQLLVQPARHLTHELAQVQLLEGEGQLARLDARDVQHLLDQPTQPHQLVLGDVQRPGHSVPAGLAALCARHLLLRHLDLQPQRRERRVQLRATRWTGSPRARGWPSAPARRAARSRRRSRSDAPAPRPCAGPGARRPPGRGR